VSREGNWLLTLAVILIGLGGLMTCFTVNGLRDRIDRLEARVSALESCP